MTTTKNEIGPRFILQRNGDGSEWVRVWNDGPKVVFPKVHSIDLEIAYLMGRAQAMADLVSRFEHDDNTS